MSEERKDKHAPEAIPEERLTPPKPRPTRAELRRIHEEALDKTLEDTFPSSDPPSTIPDPAEEDPRAA